MITLELITIRHVPPFEEVSLRTNLDDGFQTDLQGRYATDRWVFELDDPKYLAGFDCKFVLDGEVWTAGDDLEIPGTDDQTHPFYLGEVGFERPRGPVIEQGSVQTRLFDSSRPPIDREFDVIVIGSGMAGGVLADRLSDSGIDTLVLEAGGVPLETHIANLPRRYQYGFQKHVWQRWGEFQAINYDAPADGSNVYGGAQAFCLGGRSVFWGGFIPRMSSWELDYWPRHLKWDLEDSYYQMAEDVMGRSTAPPTFYSRSVHRELRQLLPEYYHFDAPVAVRKNLAGDNTISTGLFSTADLLLESYRSEGASGRENLSIRTHTLATRVEPDDPLSTVVAEDLVSGRELRFRARYVVLACGCLESARLARRSGLGGPLVGQGVTDHPIAFSHFEIPPTSPFHDRFGMVKVVSQPIEPKIDGQTRDPFNMLIELGADFNQGRFLDEDVLEQAEEKRSMLCEIVFLSNRELVLTNRLDFDDANGSRPQPRILNPGLSDDVKERIENVTELVLTALGGTVINSGDGDGGLGGVAHEVGSLRMQVTDSNNIANGLQTQLDGVVDEDGKFLDQESIYVCDLSIFPTSPAANPSLTAVALAMRLADRLRQLMTS